MLTHAVVPLMEAVGKLTSGRVPPVCANSATTFATSTTIWRASTPVIDTIRDTIGTAIQVNLSMVALGENDVHKRLAAWAGIFAVATAFAGIWGMNFKVMPELDWEYGYPGGVAFHFGGVRLSVPALQARRLALRAEEIAA